MKETIDSFGKLSDTWLPVISKVTIKRALKWVITFSVLVALGFYIYNHFLSNDQYYANLEKQVGLIKEIKTMAPKDSTIQKAAKGEMLRVLRELKPIETESLFSTYIHGLFDVPWWVVLMKIIGGILLGLMIAISVGFEEKPDTDGIAGGLVIGIIGAVIALCVPIVFHWSINLFAMPIAQFLLILLLMLIFPEEETE